MNLLLIFDRVICTRNFTRAAQSLDMTQSAVSQSVGRLRDIFDDPLFIRQQAGIKPTAKALELHPQIDQLLQQAKQLFSQAEEFDPAKINRIVNIAMWDNENTVFAPQLLSRIGQVAPGLSVSIRPLIRQEALRALGAGDVDLAVGYYERSPSSYLKTHLYNEEFVVVARKSHPDIQEPFDMERYLKARHILVSWSGDFDGAVDRMLQKRGLKRILAASIPTFQSALHVVRGSDLVATLPKRLVENLCLADELQVFDPPFNLEGFPVSILCHPRNRSDPAIELITDIFKDIASGSA